MCIRDRSKLKSKVDKKNRAREKVQIDPELVPDTLIDEPAVEFDIVRNKTFALSVMSPQEAALQMDLLNHGFYMFANAETGLTAVVYRREDGDIGLINAA